MFIGMIEKYYDLALLDNKEIEDNSRFMAQYDKTLLHLIHKTKYTIENKILGMGGFNAYILICQNDYIFWEIMQMIK